MLLSCLLGSNAYGAEFAGLWTLTIDTPRGARNPTLEIVEQNGAYSGTYNSVRGPIAIDVITTEANSFEFPLKISVPIGEISVNYKGQISGDKMTGLVENPRGEVPFSGARN